MDLKEMDHTTRRRLIQMACVAAWSDMSIQDEERQVVLDLATQLAITGEELEMVRKWLKDRPPEFDPYDIPQKHRKAFLEAFVNVIEADGRIDPEESESIRLLRELVR